MQERHFSYSMLRGICRYFQYVLMKAILLLKFFILNFGKETMIRVMAPLVIY